MEADSPINVLLVDDDRLTNTFHQEVLKGIDRVNSVDAVDSGKKALHFLSERIQKGPQIPELILVDIYMPEMSGFEFMESLEKVLDTNQLKSKTMVNVLSSTQSKTDIERFVNSTLAVKFISKPLSREKLKSVFKWFDNRHNEIPQD